MSETLCEEIKSVLAPNGVWTLRPIVKEIIEKEIARLPKSINNETLEKRYPITPSGMRDFINTFFARHYFQVQDTILEENRFESFRRSIERGAINIADIGSGPAVASLAVMDLLDVIHQITGARKARVSSLINDISGISLHTGKQFIESYVRQTNNSLEFNKIVAIETPFPKSLVQMRRIATYFKAYHLCFMSYVLIPLKGEMTYREIQSQINELMRYCSWEGACKVIQDKFRESLIRRIGQYQGVSTHEAYLTQEVYDENNTNQTQTYMYYRTIIMPTAISGDYGASKRLCAQNEVSTRF